MFRDIFKYIPNILTFSRILSIPVIILTFYFEDSVLGHKLGGLLFITASVTDFFDGYLARKYDITSNFGRIFDPIADKLLVGAVLMLMVKFNRADEIPCLLILLREFTIAGLREVLSEIKVSVPVSNLAKVKTTIQMIALSILILGSKGSGVVYLDTIGRVMLWLAALLTIFTAVSYFKAAMHYLKEGADIDNY